MGSEIFVANIFSFKIAQNKQKVDMFVSDEKSRRHLRLQ